MHENEENVSDCPECKSGSLRSHWDPPSYTIECNECGFSAVTSKFPPIFEDQNIYQVHLIPEGSNISEAIRYIKRYLEKSTIEGKELIDSGEELMLLEGKAIDILIEVEGMRKKELNLRIEPLFPYTSKDLMGMKIV